MPIGYGDVGTPAVNTTISYGGNPDNRYITYYARRQFNVADAADFTSASPVPPIGCPGPGNATAAPIASAVIQVSADNHTASGRNRS